VGILGRILDDKEEEVLEPDIIPWSLDEND
jgi:hypothetical protein